MRQDLMGDADNANSEIFGIKARRAAPRIQRAQSSTTCDSRHSGWNNAPNPKPRRASASHKAYLLIHHSTHPYQHHDPHKQPVSRPCNSSTGCGGTLDLSRCSQACPSSSAGRPTNIPNQPAAQALFAQGVHGGQRRCNISEL